MKKIQFSYPVFFSSCSADEVATGNYISKFHKHFSTIISDKLAQEGLDVSVPIMDTIDLPISGNIDRLLDEYVKKSFALFIFVGKGYLKSNYCFDELKYFSNLLNHARDELQERVWIFELEPFTPELRTSFQTNLSKAKAVDLTLNVRRSLYDPRTKELIPLGDPYPTDQCINLLRPIADDLVDQIKRTPLLYNSPQSHKIVRL
jgi:hypothetical protein